MVVAEVVVAGLIAVEFRGATGDAVMPTGPAIAVLFFTCLFVSGFAWSWGPLGWLIPSEIQPLETRSAGQVCTACSRSRGASVLSRLIHGVQTLSCHGPERFILSRWLVSSNYLLGELPPALQIGWGWVG